MSSGGTREGYFGGVNGEFDNPLQWPQLRKRRRLAVPPQPLRLQLSPPLPPPESGDLRPRSWRNGPQMRNRWPLPMLRHPLKVCSLSHLLIFECLIDCFLRRRKRYQSGNLGILSCASSGAGTRLLNSFFSSWDPCTVTSYPQ